MRFVTVVFLLFLIADVGCGPTAQHVCSDYATAKCTALFNCAPGASQAAYPDGGVQECANQLEGLSNCSGAQAYCPLGTSYDTGNAEKCVGALNAAGTDAAGAPSCNDVLSHVDPPSCSLSVICH